MPLRVAERVAPRGEVREKTGSLDSPDALKQPVQLTPVNIDALAPLQTAPVSIAPPSEAEALQGIPPAEMALGETAEAMRDIPRWGRTDADRIARYHALMNAARGGGPGGLFQRLVDFSALRAAMNVSSTVRKAIFKDLRHPPPKLLEPPLPERIGVPSLLTMLVNYYPPEIQEKVFNQRKLEPVEDRHVLTVGAALASVSYADREIVVSFPGTNSFGDILSDYDDQLVDGAAYGGGQVHAGFAAKLEPLWSQIKEAIAKARAEHPEMPVVFTGHSLGAGEAVLAIARAKEEGLLEPTAGQTGAVARLETYGQPRVGDDDFARHFERELRDVPYLRYVNARAGDDGEWEIDPVTEVPGRHAGYRHINTAQVIRLEVDGPHLLPSADTDESRQPVPGSLVEDFQIGRDFLSGLILHFPRDYIVKTLRRPKSGPWDLAPGIAEKLPPAAADSRLSWL